MDKLVNFFDFASLNQLRHSMGADLIQEFKFDSGILLLDDDFISRLDGDGIEVDGLDEIDFRGDKTLGYKGQRVLIYIRDVSPYREKVSLPRFHISTCDTLVKMWKRKRAERYVLYRRENGIFQVNVIRDGKIDIRHEKLNVCRNCLTNLNWNSYSDEKPLRNKIVSEFSISEFFETFPKSLLSVKPRYDADNAPLNDYTASWNQISKEAKRKAGYRCTNEPCGVSLTGNHSQYLHVHHIDGQKNNNKKYNLKVLCVRCHGNEPSHGHMKLSQDYKRFISMYDEIKSQN
ncbi:HNH endonuclease [Legionella antarctica]|nr:HNH endonuclease [Legionella antarctica]